MAQDLKSDFAIFLHKTGVCRLMYMLVFVLPGNNGAYNASLEALYQDNMQSYSTTEPGIDLSATSFLMWSWRLAGHPAY